jgi:hypothetical protein
MHPGEMSLYIADRGIDNGDDPDENDGLIFEISNADISLPVTLAGFSANIFENNVLLTWVTESEIENVGFELLRADEENGQYKIITSYKENTDLLGQGNSSVRHEYYYADEMIEPGKTYWYMLVDWDIYGIKSVHNPISITIPLDAVSPVAVKLYPNYPNPFNPTTNLKFEIPVLSSGTADTKIIIYNNLGQLVKVLYQENLTLGTYQVEWDGTTDNRKPAPAGIYFAQLSIGPHSQIIKMLLLK